MRVVVEHPVLVVPDDVLWRPPHDLGDDALEADGRAALVELLRHRSLALVHHRDARGWEKRRKKVLCRIEEECTNRISRGISGSILLHGEKSDLGSRKGFFLDAYPHEHSFSY